MTTERRATLVDANVLLDVFTQDPRWEAWSLAALAATLDHGPAVINPIILAEVSARFSRMEDLDRELPPDVYQREQLPWPAAYLAGRAHLRYRQRGGARHATLPDFLIGAHAAVAGLRLLTRDPRRVRAYFPTVELIAPT